MAAVPVPPVPPLPVPPPQIVPPPPAPQVVERCDACGDDPLRLPPDVHVCPRCRRLRPLTLGYRMDTSVFMWAQDGAAMARLRSIGPINKAAQAISDTVGRRWVETTFNAVRLGENQLPHV